MYCSSCGDRIDDSSKFCSGCGAKIGETNRSEQKEISTDSMEPKMGAFRLEKQNRKSIIEIFYFTLVLGIFYHGAWIACIVAGIVLFAMYITKKDTI